MRWKERSSKPENVKRKKGLKKRVLGIVRNFKLFPRDGRTIIVFVGRKLLVTAAKEKHGICGITTMYTYR